MVLSYRILFSVELLHEYFNKDIFSDCTILTSDETKVFFEGDNLLQRFFDNRLYVLLKDNGGKPYSPINPSRVFRFYLKNKRAEFFNYSNLDDRIGKGSLLYFSNLANNKQAADLNLSAPIQPYDGVTIYQVGNFVKDPVTQNIFESIKQGSGNALADTTAWFPRSAISFVSDADVITQTSNNFRYTFSSPIKKIQTTVKGYKVSGTSLTEYDVFSTQQIFPDVITDVAVDLSQLSFGKYKIILDATTDTNANIHKELTIYYDRNAQQQGIVGVIEIYNFLPSADDYAMLDNTGVIKETKYTIRFANKNALWKYITQTTNVNDIITGVAGLSFTKNSKTFTSNKPILFKQIPDSAFVLEFSNSSPPDPIKAPFPSPSNLKCEKNPDGSIKNFFTEIYLNF